MGKTSATVKNRWNADHYELIRINVFKGDKQKYIDRAAQAGQSLSEYTRSALEEYHIKSSQK